MDLINETALRNVLICHVFQALRSQAGIKYEQALKMTGEQYHVSIKSVEEIIRKYGHEKDRLFVVREAEP